LNLGRHCEVDVKMGSQLTSEILDRLVYGRNLVPGLFRDQLEGGPTLVVFLRHFG
jgi:hypothetical protein